MPFPAVEDLPETIRNVLPIHAQHIYRDAFNNAWNEYKKPDSRRTNDGREEIAHKVAWSAVKNSYERASDGRWRKKR